MIKKQRVVRRQPLAQRFLERETQNKERFLERESEWEFGSKNRKHERERESSLLLLRLSQTLISPIYVFACLFNFPSHTHFCLILSGFESFFILFGGIVYCSEIRICVKFRGFNLILQLSSFLFVIPYTLGLGVCSATLGFFKP